MRASAPRGKDGHRSQMTEYPLYDARIMHRLSKC